MSRNPELSYLPILLNSGPFTDQEYEYPASNDELKNSNILVIGAGGLGCEILKDLALSGFRKITVIDMDTIELTNLNRQFLFTLNDVGKPKATVAAHFVNNRVKSSIIKSYCGKIQDFDETFYKQFTMVICGLDSIEARRWINKMLVDIAIVHGRYIPIIDGGTEGFQGSVKLIIPTITACFECYMPLVPEKKTYPLCTLASTPRLPEHCIEWAHQLEWGRVYPDIEFDADIPEHVQWMYELALKRAQMFGIEGVTKSETLGVVKNIIPAIASTNAIIAAACCNEAFKFITSCNPSLKDTMYYNGEGGVVAVSDEYHKLENCSVCGNRVEIIELNDSDISCKEFAELVKEKYKLAEPNIFYGTSDLYNFKSPDGTKDTNEKRLTDVLKFDFLSSDVIVCKTELLVIDKHIENFLRLNVNFQDQT